MNKHIFLITALLLILIVGVILSERENVQDTSMSFFITSTNPGNGANFGGLAGADAHCSSLAKSAGVEDKTWKAYLSAGATDITEQVNSRDRIGNGPWYNATGVMIAASINELHGENNINKQTALDENGNQVMGRGDEVNLHDILTGSSPEGTFVESDGDTTCNNWTSSSEGSAIVGHHDRVGLDDSDAAKSWNSSHGSRGCSLDNLRSTGGGGLIYCFAE